eukprot:347464-Chlamydomonas_euryale.AAC.6
MPLTPMLLDISVSIAAPATPIPSRAPMTLPQEGSEVGVAARESMSFASGHVRRCLAPAPALRAARDSRVGVALLPSKLHGHPRNTRCCVPGW